MPAVRIPVTKDLLSWARDRSGLSDRDLTEKFNGFPQWLTGSAQPTLNQLKQLAKVTRTPFGYFLLAKPPAEELQVPDFRTVQDRAVERLSPDLLDVIDLCLHRQEWYRQEAKALRASPLEFVGSMTPSSAIVSAAESIASEIGFRVPERAQMATWTEALSLLIRQVDASGILTMVSGIVGSNTRRVLDPAEFRGFAITDPVAPLVFVNGTDSKAAQMFTLAHEVAHIWLGKSGVSDAGPDFLPTRSAEGWCNRVAAELLVPLADFRDEIRLSASTNEEAQRLAKHFKVSSLVILRRMRDMAHIKGKAFSKAYEHAISLQTSSKKNSGGGNFYNTLPVRSSRRFTTAILASTLEGRTSFTEAFKLLGVSSVPIIKRLAKNLGVLD